MQLPYRFGRYVLTEKIAQGGMAEIFRAQYLGEGGFSKEVVIKRLLSAWSDNPEFIKMLIDEARALVYLAHPNIVQVFELGRDGKIFYISMEWVEGTDLRKLFSRALEIQGAVPLKFSLHVIGEVLKALQFAHQREDEKGRPLHLVHRDISPQNILLSLKGEVKLADFGIAKGLHRTWETAEPQIKGKVAYMSPEQARGEAVAAQSDLYSLGVIFYELLEGRRLFDGINDLATLDLARTSRLPNDALQRWPAFLQVIVFKALNKDPRYRYTSAKEFLGDLQRFVAMQNLRTDSLEFAEYLGEAMPKSVEVFKCRSVGVKEDGKNNERRRWRGVSKISAGILIAMVAMTFSGWWIWRKGPASRGAAPPASVTPSPNPTAAGPPQPAILKISAKPWGLVTIPPAARSRETPINKLQLEPGTYRLQIQFPPQNLSLTKELELASGSVMRCYADFEGIPHIRCK